MSAPGGFYIVEIGGHPKRDNVAGTDAAAGGTSRGFDYDQLNRSTIGVTDRGYDEKGSVVVITDSYSVVSSHLSPTFSC
jgi:hypothetical protein